MGLTTSCIPTFSSSSGSAARTKSQVGSWGYRAAQALLGSGLRSDLLSQLRINVGAVQSGSNMSSLRLRLPDFGNILDRIGVGKGLLGSRGIFEPEP